MVPLTANEFLRELKIAELLLDCLYCQTGIAKARKCIRLYFFESLEYFLAGLWLKL